MKKLIKSKLEAIVNDNKHLEIVDILDEVIDYTEADTADKLIEELQERIGEEQVIYYSIAMEYLTENDNSLNESIELANNMGCAIESINSELLATLLCQDKIQGELGGLISDIEEAFND